MKETKDTLIADFEFRHDKNYFIYELDSLRKVHNETMKELYNLQSKYNKVQEENKLLIDDGLKQSEWLLKLKQENDGLKAIIKEAREYIKSHFWHYDDIDDLAKGNELLNILDKASDQHE
jgi:predicted nuclease with TOPRIM domain